MTGFSSARRQAIKTIGAALAASALPMPFINLSAQEQNFAGKTLRLLTWSDDTGAAALRNIAATFTAKTGAKVIADRADGTSGHGRQGQGRGRPPDLRRHHAGGRRRRGSRRRGSAVKPDLDKLPNLKDVARAVPHGRERLRCRLSAVVRRPDLQHVDRQDAALVVRSAVGSRSTPAACSCRRPSGPKRSTWRSSPRKCRAARSRTSIPASRS